MKFDCLSVRLKMSVVYLDCRSASTMNDDIYPYLTASSNSPRCCKQLIKFKFSKLSKFVYPVVSVNNFQK